MKNKINTFYPKNLAQYTETLFTFTPDDPGSDFGSHPLNNNPNLTENLFTSLPASFAVSLPLRCHRDTNIKMHICLFPCFVSPKRRFSALSYCKFTVVWCKTAADPLSAQFFMLNNILVNQYTSLYYATFFFFYQDQSFKSRIAMFNNSSAKEPPADPFQTEDPFKSDPFKGLNTCIVNKHFG